MQGCHLSRLNQRAHCLTARMGRCWYPQRMATVQEVSQ